MKIVLYQIISELDYSRLMFENYKQTIKRCKGKIHAKLYEIAYSGELDVNTPGDVYRIFNTDFSDGYRGRSMSVSDVVEFRYSAEKSVFYFCDSVGFKEIEFDADKAMLPVSNRNFDKVNIRKENVSIFYVDNNGLQQRKCKFVTLKRCRYSESQVGYRLELETIDNLGKVQKQDFLSKPLVVVSKCLEDFPRELLYVDCGKNTKMRYGSHSDENLGIVGTWLMRKGFDYDVLK